MKPSEIIFRSLSHADKNSRPRFFIYYSVSTILPVGVFLGGFLFPVFITTPAILFVFLLGIMISSWTGGYKAGLITTVFFIVLFNIPFSTLTPATIVPFEIRALIDSFLFIVVGFLVSVITDAARKQERILMYKAREKEFKKNIEVLSLENDSFLKEIKKRDEFLSIASHELKTPLTSMLLQTQTALHNIRNVSLAHFSIDSLLKMLESVEQQTKRLSKMINELFSVSILATKNLTLEREKTDLNQLTHEILNDFEERLVKENYIVTFTPHDELIGSWDKVRIAQTITNLVSNAIKYGEKKPIEIETKKKYKWAEFVITDHGIGISKKEQKEIFGLFERAVPADSYKGLGVGLYISKQIIDAHGGTIVVDSSVGRGTTFVMRLPLEN